MCWGSGRRWQRRVPTRAEVGVRAMSYDEGLGERIRDALSDRSDVSEKRMFGGLAFLVRGHMCVGIVKHELMVRVGPEAYGELVRQPHARRMEAITR